MLNTIDKGYSVIITLPDKMSLVGGGQYSVPVHFFDVFHRRRKLLFAP